MEEKYLQIVLRLYSLLIIIVFAYITSLKYMDRIAGLTQTEAMIEKRFVAIFFYELVYYC